MESGLMGFEYPVLVIKVVFVIQNLPTPSGRKPDPQAKCPKT